MRSLNFFISSCSSSTLVSDFPQGNPNKSDPNGFLLPGTLNLIEEDEGSSINAADKILLTGELGI